MLANRRHSVDRGPSDDLNPAFCLTILAMAGLCMLSVTWGTWPDVLVDFGRELYVPWRLLNGQRLYADLAYFNGPFSPYLNALWFRLFGVGLRTLVWCNIALTAILTWLLYRLATAISNRATGVVAGLTFLIFFACSQLVEIGNYNFICPYSHDLTHGILLSVLAIFTLWRYHCHHHVGYLTIAGGLLGLVFLTKVEVFLAAGSAVAIGVAVTVWMEQPGGHFPRTLWISFLAGVVVPPILALWLLSRAMPITQALRGIAGSWPWALNHELHSMLFYRWVMGTRDLIYNLKQFVAWIIGYTVVFLSAAALDLMSVRWKRYQWGVAIGFAALLVVLLAWWWHRPKFWGGAAADAFRPLPLIMAILGVICFVQCIKQGRHEIETRPRLVLQLVMTVFALTLLGKMLLNTHLYHYGFALAMPATIMLVVASAHWAPAALQRRGATGRVVRLTALVVWVAVIGAHLRVVGFWSQRKTCLVGLNAADRFWADERGPLVNAMAKEINERLAPNDTLVAMPEGVMLNYLTRRVNSTPYVTFMPPEVVMFGEDQILAFLQRQTPDYIALVHKNTSEYGVQWFGGDYGRRLGKWVREHYRLVVLVGSPPFVDDRFGISLLRRREGP